MSKSSEEVISMFIGLVVVIVAGWLVVNYFQKHKGSVDLPGVSTSVNLEKFKQEDSVVKEEKKAENSGSYVVVKGDSLWKIAEKKYNDGYKWSEIAKANNLKTPGSLEVGQKLILPTIEKKDTTIGQTIKVPVKSEHIVVKGDSLWKVAVENYADGFVWSKIWQANKTLITNPNNLEIGTKLVLPRIE